MNDPNTDGNEDVETETEEEEDENPSYLGGHTMWRSVDEPSLYSNVEENASSDIHSSLRGISSQPISPPYTSRERDGGGGNVEEEDSEEYPVQMRWITAEEMDAEEDSSGALRFPYDDGMDDIEQDEGPLGHRHNARRSILVVMFLLGIALVLVLTVALALWNRETMPEARVSGGISDPNFDPRAGNPTPSTPSRPVTPAAPVTTSSTSSTSTTTVQATIPPPPQDPRQFVWDAVTSCPQTNPVDLIDLSEIQMEVFEVLVAEVFQLAETVDGKIVYDPKVGYDWILEKWGMLNLFFFTDGEFWRRGLNWYSYQDVCNWYNQAPNHCKTRLPGGAAVTKIKLGKLLVGP